MANITYHKGDATKFEDSPVMLAHICNDVGVWAAGFVVAVSRLFGTEVEDYYRGFLKTTTTPLGKNCIVVKLDLDKETKAPQKIVLANMIAQHGVRGAHDKIDYAALKSCLEAADEHAIATGCKWIQMPRIGCGLAGSTWQKILPYLETLKSDIRVFDLP